MQRIAVTAGALLALLGCSPGPDDDQAAGAARQGETDPRVEEILRSVSDLLAGAQQFSFHAEIFFEELEYKEVANDGAEPEDDPEMIVTISDHEGRADFTLSRPDKLRVSYRDDMERREFFLSGNTATMAEPHQRVYAVLATPGTIDTSLDTLWDRAGVAPPVSDLLYEAAYDRLAPNILSSSYEGLDDVNGISCHHILLTQETMDWQLWVDAGDQALPRKIEITYRDELLQPVFVAEFGGWDFEPTVPPEMFIFDPPEGAVKVDSLKSADETNVQGANR